VANIITAQASKHEAILRASWRDLVTFGKYFLPGDFRKSKTPLFHYEIGDELVSDSNKPCAIIIARGHAKTTLVKGSIIRDFCFAHFAKQWGLTDLDEEHLFYGWCSTSQKKSQNNVSYVRLNLKYNEKIRFYFGDQMAKFQRDNQEDIITGYGDRLMSGSNLVSFRGDTLATMESGAVRYSRVLIDDAENEENTRTQNSREKLADNIMNGIYPAIEKNRPGCRMFFIATPVHYDAFAQKILDKWHQVEKDGQEAIDKYAWKVITYKATQPDMPGGVLWESYLPRKKLDEIKQVYIDTPGKGVAGYYQEYELEVQSREHALWRREHLKYWDGYFAVREGRPVLIIDGEYIPVNTFLGCDPATDIETKYSDYSVIMVVGVDANNNIYVIDYVREKSIPTLGLRGIDGEIDGKKGVVDYLIEMYDKYLCKSGTVEDVPMNRTIFQDLNRVRKQSNRFDIGIQPEKPGGRDKINRIYSGLNGRFASGGLFVKEGHYDLIDEILKFGPKMAHDDCVDALWYACRYAYPYKGGIVDSITGEFQKKTRKVKSWIVN
jgi:phage terminase large subunit-like protein